ncbi:ribosomal RNA-processing 8 [Pelobates cultripes]|uniref:Ribosomal RNA-processing protein 8 n=1 Tax=Pelobates cultripes TaxID=61616 RepID=A0AAD1VPV1_PELCU|nr:ribosomal RNA-processing 8 [Pelobates cultripes]
MFDLCDWNDSSEAQSLFQSFKKGQPGEKTAKKETVSDAKFWVGFVDSGILSFSCCGLCFQGITSRKKRLKRTQKLLDVLRILEAPSDYETAIPPKLQVSPVTKRRKHGKEQTEPDAPRAPESESSDPMSAELTVRVSRKQWRNRMKNKKRNKNKFTSPLETVARSSGSRDRNNESAMVSGQSGESLQVTGCIKNQVRQRKFSEPSNSDLGGKELGDEVATIDCPAPRGLPIVTAQDKRRLQKLKKIVQGSGRDGDVHSGPHHTKEEDKGDLEKQKDENEGKGPQLRKRINESFITLDQNENVLPEDRSASLRSRMEKRLSSARFRYINEELYTSDSSKARSLFENDPEAFVIYHSGFSQQVQHWPVNPIMEVIKYVKNRPLSLVVADFGCGDALLARSVRNKVHSFDLVALNDCVTVCDIAQVPLSDETVDVAVFCLSLMGTNLSEFLQEANRVLKMEGVLLVAEVSSRFDDVRQFLSAMAQLGFKNVTKNTDSSYFFLFEFIKIGLPRECVKHPGLSLKPCLYKKR